MPPIMRYRGRIRIAQAGIARLPAALLLRSASSQSLPASPPNIRQPPSPLTQQYLATVSLPKPPRRPPQVDVGRRIGQLPARKKRGQDSALPQHDGEPPRRQRKGLDLPKAGHLPLPNTTPMIRRRDIRAMAEENAKLEQEQTVMSRLRQVVLAQHSAIQAEVREAAGAADEAEKAGKASRTAKGQGGGSAESSTSANKTDSTAAAIKILDDIDERGGGGLFMEMLTLSRGLLKNGSFAALEAYADLVLALIIQRPHHSLAGDGSGLARRLYLESLLFNRPADEKRTMQYARYYAVHVMNRLHHQLDDLAKSEAEVEASTSAAETSSNQHDHSAEGQSFAQKRMRIVEPHLKDVHHLVKFIAEHGLPPVLSEPIWALMLYLQQWVPNQWLPPKQLMRPNHRTVLDLLGRMLRDRGIAAEPYSGALNQLIDLYCYPGLPGQERAVVDAIDQLSRDRQPEMLINLWLRYRARLYAKENALGNDEITAINTAVVGTDADPNSILDAASGNIAAKLKNNAEANVELNGQSGKDAAEEAIAAADSDLPADTATDDSQPKGTRRADGNKRTALTKFLSALLNPVMDTGNSSPYPSARQYAAQVIHFSPRPMPAIIHHIILRDRARMVGEIVPFVNEKEASSLIPDKLGKRAGPSRNGLAYKDMLVAWKDCGKDGCRDVEAYMVYITALAKIHAVDLLESLWEELNNDDRARKLWRGDQTSRSNILRYKSSLTPRDEEVPERISSKVDPEIWPPTAVLNHFISAFFYCGPDGFERALELARSTFETGSKLKGDIITINTLMRHYARHTDIGKMQQTMAVAEAFNIEVDVVTFTTLIQGVLRAQRPALVPGILTDMAAKGLRPNGHMMSLLVADLAKAGERPALKRADQFIQSMKAQGIKPSVETWTSLISGYLRGSWMADAWDTLDRARAEGIAFNCLAYNFMLGQTRALDVPAVFDEILAHGIEPNSDTYWLAISKLWEQKMWNDMEKPVAMLEREGKRIRWRPMLKKIVAEYRVLRPRLLTPHGHLKQKSQTEQLYVEPETTRPEERSDRPNALYEPIGAEGEA